jgi:hypothetical protein
MTLLAGDEGDLQKREWPKWFCARYALPRSVSIQQERPLSAFPSRSEEGCIEVPGVPGSSGISDTGRTT